MAPVRVRRVSGDSCSSVHKRDRPPAAPTKTISFADFGRYALPQGCGTKLATGRIAFWSRRRSAKSAGLSTRFQ